MTRTMHDSFTKEWMEGILTDFGEVTIEKQIAGEVRKIDLYFYPNPEAMDLRSVKDQRWIDGVAAGSSLSGNDVAPYFEVAD